MRLETAFDIAAQPDQAWQHLLDTSGLAQCVPSFNARSSAANGIHAGELTISRNGASIRGLGRLQAIDADLDRRTVSIGLDGRELGGPAIVSGLLTASVIEQSGATRVLLSADVGFAGHSATADTVRTEGQRLLDEFGAALGRRIVEHPVAGDGHQPTSSAPASTPLGERSMPEEPEVLDLGSVLAKRMLTRYGPLGVSVICVAMLVWMALHKPPRR